MKTYIQKHLNRFFKGVGRAQIANGFFDKNGVYECSFTLITPTEKKHYNAYAHNGAVGMYQIDAQPIDPLPLFKKEG